MCQKTVVMHSLCGHNIPDIFPCEQYLDTGSCASGDPKTITEQTNCPDCKEDAHLAAAMKQIETDASLAAVPTTMRDPSAPKRWAKTREYYTRCGHYANVMQQDFELEDGSPEYITEELPGSCHGCCAALPWQIEQKKQRGEWNADPWGELSKLTTTEGNRNMSGDVGSSRQPAGATASGSAPPRHEIHTDNIHLAPAALPGARYVDYGGENGNGDTTPGKNKGIAGRPPRTRAYQAEPEPEYGLDDEETLHSEHDSLPPPNHFSDDDDYSSMHAQASERIHSSPLGYGNLPDEDFSDDDYPATQDRGRNMRRNRSYSRSPLTSPSGHLDLDDMAEHSDDEYFNDEPYPEDEARGASAPGAEDFIEISPEDRLKYKIPALHKLTAVGFENWKRRLNGEASEHMMAYKAGTISEQDQ